MIFECPWPSDEGEWLIWCFTSTPNCLDTFSALAAHANTGTENSRDVRCNEAQIGGAFTCRARIGKLDAMMATEASLRSRSYPDPMLAGGAHTMVAACLFQESQVRPY